MCWTAWYLRTKKDLLHALNSSLCRVSGEPRVAMSREGAVRIVHVECSKYSTTFTAPGHGFPTGSQIHVTGLPELEMETLIVDNSRGHKFSLCRNISVEIAEVDVENSVVRTQQPHKITSSHCSVRLLPDEGHSTSLKFYHIGEIVDDVSLRLEQYCQTERKCVPAILPEHLRGRISLKHCSVVLSEAGLLWIARLFRKTYCRTQRFLFQVGFFPCCRFGSVLSITVLLNVLPLRFWSDLLMSFERYRVDSVDFRYFSFVHLGRMQLACQSGEPPYVLRGPLASSLAETSLRMKIQEILKRHCSTWNIVAGINVKVSFIEVVHCNSSWSQVSFRLNMSRSLACGVSLQKFCHFILLRSSVCILNWMTGRDHSYSTCAGMRICWVSGNRWLAHHQVQRSCLIRKWRFCKQTPNSNPYS